MNIKEKIQSQLEDNATSYPDGTIRNASDLANAIIQLIKNGLPNAEYISTDFRDPNDFNKGYNKYRTETLNLLDE
ncbi:MAG: hypothetical protein KAS32_15980 [Candidatus Peribacteraceae bacterium]|nr:hypothetical protein [Candidatus Peribacteraceae bacterium]